MHYLPRNGFIEISFSFIIIGASDATYHVMWVILFNAVDDFGIKELNESQRMNPLQTVTPEVSMESAKQKLLDEALHGALRIAGLVRHEPRVFSVPLFGAGS